MIDGTDQPGMIGGIDRRGAIGAATPLWFARHELRFAWRDFHAMATAGRRHRARYVLLAAVALGLFLHALAWNLAGPYAGVAFRRTSRRCWWSPASPSCPGR